MKMTEEGLALIKEFEGFRAEAYRDSVGIWTIGYGHTSMAGLPKVTPGLRLTQVEAHEILRRDVETFADGVRNSLQRAVTPAQFSALVSFAYNVGLGAFRGSSVLKAINADDLDAVPRRLNLWVKAGGRTLPGLVRRRAAEAALFVSQGSQTEVQAKPDNPAAKPVTESKTIAAVIAAMVLALLQFTIKGLGIALGLALVAAILLLLAFILRERFLKLRDEVL